MTHQIKEHLDKIRDELQELSKSIKTPDEWTAFNALEISLHNLLSAFEYEINNKKEN